jgi:hypothetical protein
MSRSLWATLGLALTACGGEDLASIVIRWSTPAEGALAPPGEGPDRRILVAGKDSGTFLTLEAGTGRTVEGPFALFPTLHAPVAIGADLYLVSSVGRIVRVNLAGETLPSPAFALGRTGPPVVGADGALRLVATSGRLVIVAGEEVRADVTVDGVAETAPAVANDGVTYVATDTGAVLGISATGATVFTAAVNAPASGPSVSGDRVAVGALDAVVVFERSGAMAFRAPRAARVVGTLWDGSELLAWGEDGKLERYGPDGSVINSFNAGPPIYGPVAILPTGKVAVFDSTGRAHRVTKEGVAEANLELGQEAGRQAAQTELGWVVVSVGSEAKALDFEVEL